MSDKKKKPSKGKCVDCPLRDKCPKDKGKKCINKQKKVELDEINNI